MVIELAIPSITGRTPEHGDRRHPLLNTDRGNSEDEGVGVKKFHANPGTVKGNRAFQVVREEEPKYA
jgi:flagellar motor switch protein FliM